MVDAGHAALGPDGECDVLDGLFEKVGRSAGEQLAAGSAVGLEQLNHSVVPAETCADELRVASGLLIRWHLDTGDGWPP